MLTHGAGGSRESALLKKICDEWARRGWLAVRYNLPYRRRRPKGPPSGSAAGDREGILEAVATVRQLATGPVIAGGHSYGGRQTSMAVADEGLDVDVLTLFSYPLHPPGKPDRPRTEHLPRIAAPTVFTHGTSDPFGTHRRAARRGRADSDVHRGRRGHRRPPRPRLQDTRCPGARGRRGATVALVTMPPGSSA